MEESKYLSTLISSDAITSVSGTIGDSLLMKDTEDITWRLVPGDANLIDKNNIPDNLIDEGKLRTQSGRKVIAVTNEESELIRSLLLFNTQFKIETRAGGLGYTSNTYMILNNKLTNKIESYESQQRKHIRFYNQDKIINYIKERYLTYTYKDSNYGGIDVEEKKTPRKRFVL